MSYYGIYHIQYQTTTYYTTYHDTTHHIISYHTTLYHIIPHHIKSHHIISHNITPHHITSHHITSHPTPPHLTLYTPHANHNNSPSFCTYNIKEIVMYISFSSNKHNREHKNMYQVNIEGQTTERNPEFC